MGLLKQGDCTIIKTCSQGAKLISLHACKTEALQKNLGGKILGWPRPKLTAAMATLASYTHIIYILDFGQIKCMKKKKLGFKMMCNDKITFIAHLKYIEIVISIAAPHFYLASSVLYWI